MLRLVKSVSDIAVSQDVGWICGVISELFSYLSDNHTQMSAIGYITAKVKGGMKPCVRNGPTCMEHEKS